MKQPHHVARIFMVFGALFYIVSGVGVASQALSSSGNWVLATWYLLGTIGITLSNYYVIRTHLDEITNGGD